MDKKVMIFVAIGLIGVSVFCGLLASGTDGYDYRLGSFGVWRLCIGNVCSKYGQS